MIYRLLVLLFFVTKAHAQSTDVFLMPGSDFTRPGLLPRANLNIGIGHTFGVLNGSPVGDELTFAYTYENAGSHGFWHTNQGSHTETIGVMDNIALGKSKWSLYTWPQMGLTSITGGSTVQNRLYTGGALGVVYHFTPRQAIWSQVQYNKIVTMPWYTSTNIGYVYSF